VMPCSVMIGYQCFGWPMYSKTFASYCNSTWHHNPEDPALSFCGFTQSLCTNAEVVLDCFLSDLHLLTVHCSLHLFQHYKICAV